MPDELSLDKPQVNFDDRLAAIIESRNTFGRWDRSTIGLTQRQCAAA